MNHPIGGEAMLSGLVFAMDLHPGGAIGGEKEAGNKEAGSDERHRQQQIGARPEGAFHLAASSLGGLPEGSCCVDPAGPGAPVVTTVEKPLV